MPVFHLRMKYTRKRATVEFVKDYKYDGKSTPDH